MSPTAARAGRLTLLALLPALFLWRITLAGRILVGLDPFNFFYPYHDAIAAALAAGRLPQWNPWLFGGVPLLADSQAGLFYPPNWPLFTLAAPSALSVSVAGHLALAGIGLYFWARRGLGLARWGSWLAAALWALGGYLGAQVEHVNQVQAAAWLPWMLVGYDLARRPATRQPGMLLATLALALSLLAGHAQVSFISLVILALRALDAAWRAYRDAREELLRVHRTGLYTPGARAVWWRGIAAALLPLLPIVIGAASLAAIQLIPSASLSTLSTRGDGLSLREAAAFSLDPRLLLRALLPTYGYDAPLLSEYVGWIGFVGVALALVGALGGRGPARRFGLISSATGLLLAFGGFNPLFWMLWRLVPGFDLFRAPARWLLLWALGTALLAGVGLERLREWRRMGGPLVPRRATLATLAALAAGGVLLLAVGDRPARAVVPWWIGGGGLALAVLVAARRWPRGARRPFALLVTILVLSELWLAHGALDHTRATAAEAYDGLRPVPAHLIARRVHPGETRLLSLSDLTWDPGDLTRLEARHAALLDEDATYDLVISTKLKEVLAPNQPMRWELMSADGYGGGLLPTARWVAFQRLLPLARIVPDGRLREQLTAIPAPALLDIMGVEWLIADKVDDWWSRDVYHDLGAPVALRPGAILTYRPAPLEASALSFVVDGAFPPTPGEVRIGGQRYDLADAEMVAERGALRHMWLPLEPPALSGVFELRAAARWRLMGLALVDGRLPGFEPLVADPTLVASFGGDVKVYRRVDAPGRAWVVPRALAVADPTAAAERLAGGLVDPRRETVVETSGALPEGGEGEVRWRAERPERIALEVEVPDGGWLVLADAPFPGWEVTVDGRPAEWLPANVIDRALYLEPGSHLVRWRYRTPGLVGGAMITVMGLVALALLVALPYLIKRDARGRPAERSASGADRGR